MAKRTGDLSTKKFPEALMRVVTTEERKKKAGRSGLHRLSDRRRQHSGQHLQGIHSVSSQVRQRKVRGGKGRGRWSHRKVV